MAFFKRTQSESGVSEAVTMVEPVSLPLPAPEAKNGVRDFWKHWDYLLTMVTELSEFGVSVLDAVGLTLNESILTDSDLGQIKAGDVVIERGTRVVPRMVALLTGMGIDRIMARPSPRVLIMTLSREAIPASYLVAAQAKEAGAQAHRLMFVFDSPAQLASTITEQLVRADLVVTVGGLGEGPVDLRSIIDQIGPSDFTPVAISPGRDHGFALAESKVPLVALPADAYGTFVLTKLIVEPMIAKLMGANTDPELFSAYLAQPLRITPQVLTCVPANVKDARMTVTGRPIGLPGLAMIYQANALAILATEDGLVDSDGEAFYLPLT